MRGEVAEHGDLLTAGQVASLPEGTQVVITWSGGNGPWEYVIAVDGTGTRYAAPNDDPDDRMRWYNPIDFVGKEPFHTHVSLVSDGGEDRP